MNKYLLITTALAAVSTANAKDAFEGVHVGAQVGASKPYAHKTFVYEGRNVPIAEERYWDLHGGVLFGYRSYISPDMVGGISLEGNLEKTKQKTEIRGFEIERKYNINLLGKVGFKANKSLMPYLAFGPSFSKFSIKDKDEGTEKKKDVWGLSGGLGLEYSCDPNLSYSLQYLYSYHGKKMVQEHETKIYAPESHHAITFGIKYTI